jgi:hypothetical protein
LPSPSTTRCGPSVGTSCQPAFRSRTPSFSPATSPACFSWSKALLNWGLCSPNASSVCPSRPLSSSGRNPPLNASTRATCSACLVESAFFARSGCLPTSASRTFPAMSSAWMFSRSSTGGANTDSVVGAGSSPGSAPRRTSGRPLPFDSGPGPYCARSFQSSMNGRSADFTLSPTGMVANVSSRCHNRSACSRPPHSFTLSSNRSSARRRSPCRRCACAVRTAWPVIRSCRSLPDQCWSFVPTMFVSPYSPARAARPAFTWSAVVSAWPACRSTVSIVSRVSNRSCATFLTLSSSVLVREIIVRSLSAASSSGVRAWMSLPAPSPPRREVFGRSLGTTVRLISWPRMFSEPIDVDPTPDLRNGANSPTWAPRGAPVFRFSRYLFCSSFDAELFRCFRKSFAPGSLKSLKPASLAVIRKSRSLGGRTPPWKLRAAPPDRNGTTSGLPGRPAKYFAMVLVNQSPASSSDHAFTGALSAAPDLAGVGTGRSSRASWSYLASRASCRDGRSPADRTAGRSDTFWRRPDGPWLGPLPGPLFGPRGGRFGSLLGALVGVCREL